MEKMENIRGVKALLNIKNANESNYDKYEETLNGDLTETVNFNTIRSKNHQVYSMNQRKFALSIFCNKRYFYNAIESLPYGQI